MALHTIATLRLKHCVAASIFSLSFLKVINISKANHTFPVNMVADTDPKEAVDNAEVDPEAAGDDEATEPVELDVFNLKILPLTYALHQKHGLRHNDYQRYRGYCSR